MTVHHTRELHPNISVPDPHQDTFSKTTLGFWMYLMTDCLIFVTLFCAYAVLHTSTFGGPSSKDLYSLPMAFTETIVLLLSSATCGLGVLAAVKNHKKSAMLWLSVAFICGASFVSMELAEFSGLVAEGNSWTRSAFLTSFFALVGTHGLHVSIGLFWLLVIIGQLFFKGITKETFRRLVVFSMFWHFLDLVWIFIFTFVYLMGVI
ncbi:MAG: cytochrome o ubiquinol oxidase subunit III [Chlamydiota bacterium]